MTVHKAVPEAQKRAADDYERFSYAYGIEGAWKRRLVRLVENLSGQRRLRKLYYANKQNPIEGESFWDAAVRLLRLELVYDHHKLSTLPADRPLVVVANHPFGVLDGLIICKLLHSVRNDFRLLVNAVLVRAPEIQQYFLPVDFDQTREALKINLDTRKRALQHLRDNGCVIIFPAGGISTSPKVIDRAVDDEWKPFTAKMILESNAVVLPVFFEGQNSRLFQLASHLSQSMRLALIFREVKRRIGKRVYIQIGDLIDPQLDPDLSDRKVLMDHLRTKTYDLERRVSLKRRMVTKLRKQ